MNHKYINGHAWFKCPYKCLTTALCDVSGVRYRVTGYASNGKVQWAPCPSVVPAAAFLKWVGRIVWFLCALTEVTPTQQKPPSLCALLYVNEQSGQWEGTDKNSPLPLVCRCRSDARCHLDMSCGISLKDVRGDIDCLWLKSVVPDMALGFHSLALN